MMETIPQQPAYNPHLKKVLKTYQLSAVKSLQGPSTVLRTEGVVTVTLVPKKEDPSPEPYITPPPPPIQLLPILTTSDQSRSELSETLLEGETISCFVVGGEKRLCLPQILNSVLRDFILPQINQVCDDLQIFCSRCNPEQLEVLKLSGILPSSAPSCGLMTKTDAERLCSALLHQRIESIPRHIDKLVTFSFKVYHECFGKCKGVCMPELFINGESLCIQCLECNGFFSPQKFVCHVHQTSENRTCHWGFESCKWRSYLLAVEEQQNYDQCLKILQIFKEQHTGTTSSGKRKQLSDLLEKCKTARSKEEEKLLSDDVILSKKPKLDDGSPPFLARLPYDTALHHYYSWQYDWASLSQVLPFRTWPGMPPLPTDKHLPKSLKDSVPSYLSHEPPVLLHPERVVPHSQSEQFETSFQPNVALAPPVHKTSHEHPPPHSIRREIKKERLKDYSNAKPIPNGGGCGTPSVPLSSSNPQLELSDTDDSTLVPVNPEGGLSDTDDSASETSLKPGHSSRVVDQVAAVLDALSDAKETTRQRVIRLVERLALRIDKVESENSRLKNECSDLRRQLDVRRKDETCSPAAVTEDTKPGTVCRSSPVSVITPTSSSPPAPAIKQEPVEFELSPPPPPPKQECCIRACRCQINFARDVGICLQKLFPEFVQQMLGLLRINRKQ
uniref:Ski oncogene n=2 Tax=Cacopsylla melanoneura TaxID=428564 RepID=A0A8D8RZ64_9HEMI